MSSHLIGKICSSILMLLLLSGPAANSQKSKKNKCEIHLKSMSQATIDYQRYHKCLGVQRGEMVASVGAGTGRIELQVSVFVDSIHWTLQDIDTTCLSKTQLTKAIGIHEQLSDKKINSDFSVVLGGTERTNLPNDTFDRIIMVDVYHELSFRRPVIEDINKALKPGGRFVILERMGKKQGEIHGCKFPKVLEADLIPDMQRFGFLLESRIIPNEKLDLTYYTFRKI